MAPVPVEELAELSAVKYWYRITETTYSAGSDDWGDPLPGGPTRTSLEAYRVIKETPKGVWIDAPSNDWRDRRFVNKGARKRFACPTVEEAIASYKARKRRQIAILKSRIKKVEEALVYLDKRGFYVDSREWLGIPMPSRLPQAGSIEDFADEPVQHQ